MAFSTVLIITADVSEIPRVSAALDEAMRSCEFSDDAILDLQLAVEEAVVNSVVHGYRGAPGDVSIAIHATHEAVEVRIEDCAPPFNPLSIPGPDRQSNLDQRRIGGLGIYLLRQVVDEIAYAYTNCKNVLTLVKRKTS